MYICIYIYIYSLCICIHTHTYTSISIFYLGSLSFCLENTEDVENLEMSRKEVCWINICMLTSAEESIANDAQNIILSQGWEEKERKWKNGDMGGIEMKALNHLQLLVASPVFFWIVFFFFFYRVNLSSWIQQITKITIMAIP